MTQPSRNYRYFISYSGIKLPLNLVNEINLEQLHNRNTFYRAAYDEQGRMILCQKVIYSEVDTQHEYAYDTNGNLIFARVTEGDEVRELHFAV
jgi:YD repeat-containing protein